MKEITSQELSEYGICTAHHVMDNGERRFRLIGADGSAYIRTEATECSGWQNSHLHRALRELYFVSSGFIRMAVLRDGRVEIQTLTAGETFLTEPGVAHNCYMGPNAVTHTVKFGAPGEADWIAAPELDALLKEMDI